MPLFEEKLISPLVIRFSQARIRPTFQDRRTVQSSLDEIQYPEVMEDSNIARQYDILLDAPFPPIEIIRWKPKLRDQEGNALKHCRGQEFFGEECWFTFDNRRLYCLQAAASRQWPKRVAAVARVMYDIPVQKSAVKKFKTSTSGRSIVISRRNDVVPRGHWDWVESVRHLTCDPSAALHQLQADGCKATKEELLDAPEPGPVRSRAIGTEGQIHAGQLSQTKVSVQRLFQFHNQHAVTGDETYDGTTGEGCWEEDVEGYDQAYDANEAYDENESWFADPHFVPSSPSDRPARAPEATEKSAQGKGQELLALIMGGGKSAQNQQGGHAFPESVWVDDPPGSEDTDSVSHGSTPQQGSNDTRSQTAIQPQKVSIFDSVFAKGYPNAQRIYTTV